MNPVAVERGRPSAAFSTGPVTRPASGEPDARRWISDFAYYLWIAEGCPRARDQWHWYQAEAAYRLRVAACRTGGLQPAREAYGVQCFIARIRAGQAASPQQVALAALRAWYDVEEAFGQLADLRGWFHGEIGGQVVDEGFRILEAWKYRLTAQERTKKLVEALRGVEDCPTDADDSQPHPHIGGRMVDTEVLEEAARTFRAELPKLLKTHPRQWVAYRGKERIGFGPSKAQLTQACIGRGFAYEQLLVRMIQPDIPATRMSW